jgi:ATP-binding cassette subfamily C (CFTR/MRP) protein 1
MRIRAGLVSCIYEKALVLSNDERAGRPTGEVVNLMAVDTNRLQELCSYGYMIISGPFQVRHHFISFDRE